MTKEQEVIKRLNFHKEYARLSSNRVVISETDLETVLKMLKEKDAEIEKLKEENKNIMKLNANMSKRHLNDIFKIKKKDKMIDLMAEHICSSAIVDDTICAIKCDCETDINEDCTHEKMLNCTKQYFERKEEEISGINKTPEKN